MQELTLQAVSGITDPAQIRVTLYINNQQVHAPLVDVVVVAASGTYLPLTGGTLTGALNGTSASFSGAVSGAAGTFTGLLTTNGQVAFPATQNPSANVNTLDDYEEGTTTPTVTSGTGTITAVTCTVNYTKIGNRVDISGTLTVTTNGTGASFLIVPMPFTASQAAGFGGRNITTSLAISGAIAAGGSTMTIVRYDAVYPIGASGQSIVFSGSYIV